MVQCTISNCGSKEWLHDLQLLKDLIDFRKINKTASDVALHKIQHHLWYLRESTVPLAIFDKDVSIASKRKMVEAIRRDNTGNIDVNKIDLTNAEFTESLTLDKFVSKHSKSFFTIMNISSEFLNSDPITWEDRADFLKNRETIKKFQVINDRAERCLSLMSEYNLILTRNEEKKQAIVKIVKKFREYYSNINKKTLEKNLLDYDAFNIKE